MAENAWNKCEPETVALAYTVDTVWRNRSEFLTGREEVVTFLKKKWSQENEYRLVKELWAWEGNRIAVRFAYEWRDSNENWFRSYGNENWEFSKAGLMARRIASINDVSIKKEERKLLWEKGVRPDDYPSLSDLGL